MLCLTCISHRLSAASTDKSVPAALRSVGPSQTAAQDEPPQQWPRLVLSPAMDGPEGSQALQPQPSPPLRDESR
jgi:hypothetical protein